MFGPGWEQGCPSCSFLADHFDGAAVHLAQRDVTLGRGLARAAGRDRGVQEAHGLALHVGVVLRQRFQSRLPRVVHARGDGPAARSTTTTAIRSSRSEEAPGASVFYKDEDGDIFHTYSTYGRGLDILLGTYNFLDLVPKGRDEDGLRFHHGVGAPPRPLRHITAVMAGLVPKAIHAFPSSGRAWMPGIRLSITTRKHVGTSAHLTKGVDHEALWIPAFTEHLEGPRGRRAYRRSARARDRRPDQAAHTRISQAQSERPRSHARRRRFRPVGIDRDHAVRRQPEAEFAVARRRPRARRHRALAKLGPGALEQGRLRPADLPAAGQKPS